MLASDLRLRYKLFSLIFKENGIPYELINYAFEFLYNLSDPIIKVGDYHTNIITYNKVYSWGKESKEYFKMGNVKDVFIARNSSFILNKDNELCNNNGTKFVKLVNVKDIFAGKQSSLITTYDKKIYLWDRHSRFIQLENISNVKKFYNINVYKSIFCSNNGLYTIDMEDDCAYMKFEIKNFKDIYSGYNFSMITTSDNELYYWDYSPLQTKIESSLNIKEIFCLKYYAIILTNENELYAWFYFENTEGMTKINLNNVKKVKCSDSIVMVLTYTNEVYTFNSHLETKKIEIKNVKDIFCGELHWFIINYYNEIYSWGFNEDGRLGLSDTGYKSIPTKLNI